MARERILIIMDEVICDADSHPDELVRVIEGASEILIVAPCMTSRLESLCSDLDEARVEADRRLDIVLDYFRQSGLNPQGEVGDENPLQAIDDALADFAADALVLALHAHEEENWREHTLLERVRQRFNLPATVFLVAPDRTLVRQATTAAN